MKISTGFRAWLLKGHPDRPDFGGYDQQRREEFVRRVEGTDSSKLDEAANRPLALVESLRTAGGPGSGNFGHAGRPGEVGGSSSRATGVQSAAFKQWFGESKIVDEQGNPLVVYHGTPSKGSESNNKYVRSEQADVQYPVIESFNTDMGGVTDSQWLGQGTYFTPDPEYAWEFGDRIMPVYLSIQKPFTVHDDGSMGVENQFQFMQSLQDLKGLPDDLKLDLSVPETQTFTDYRGESRKVYYEITKGRDNEYLLLSSEKQNTQTGIVEGKGSSPEAAVFAHRYKDKFSGFLLHTITRKIGSREFRQLLEKNGYDGVVERRDGRLNEIVAFYPTQIKSAISNTGAYNPKNPLITAARKNPILAAADKYVPKFSVTFRYAFAKGRQVMRRTRDEDQAIRAITRALETVLPNTLKQAFIEGGEVGAQLLNQRRLKIAGGVGSGNFGHAGRPGQVGGSTSEKGSYSPLQGLEAEARKAGSFEEFRRDFLLETKHGLYWHITSDKDFEISELKGPRDRSSLAGDDSMDVGKLMVTSHLDNWLEEYPNRPYVALIDMRDVPKDAYRQVKRGFGNEFFVSAPQKARTVRVMTRAEAEQYDARAQRELEQLIGGDEDLRKFYDKAILKAAAKKKKTVDNDDVEVSFAFSEVHPRIAEWAEEHAAELITDITETSRKRIRNAVSDLIEEGDWELATDRIMAAVGDVERAELIAHHETMLAVSEGQREIWRQAEEEGLLDETAQRTWIVTPDEKLCPICEALDGTVADLNGEYPGGYEGPPAHVSCRCTEGITAFRTGGGAGSGNFGHAGRPGQVGGSASAIADEHDHEAFEHKKIAIYEQLANELKFKTDQLAKDNVEVTPGWYTLDPNLQEGRWNIATLHTGTTTMIDARSALREVGVEPPSITLTLVGRNDTSYAEASGISIRINPNNPAWQSIDAIQKRTIQDAAGHFHPTPEPKSIMIHEMGHVLHDTRIKAMKFEDAVRARQDPEPNMATEVSRYAKNNSFEFVAETFSGLVAGRKYSKHVMDEYAKLGGPPVPGKKAS